MNFILKSYSKNENGLYGPTATDKYYESVYYHRKKAQKMKGKNRWNLEENEEFSIFSYADDNKWMCNEKKALFSIIDNGKTALGTDGEKLAMFREPVNSGKIWHGFPVSSSEHRPSSELLDKWQAGNVVSRPTRMRIERSQL